MTNLIFRQNLSIQETIAQMQESAAFDIGEGDRMANGDYAGVIPLISNIKAKAAAPTAPKVFVSNDCVFNCEYCNCRISQDKSRYTNSPKAVADISMKMAKEDNCGVFITSAIYRNADYTEELILETLKEIRYGHGYKGYVHAKIMPGVDPLLIRQVGFLADRVSVNIEFTHSDAYKILAKQKNKNNILSPMAYVRNLHKEINPKRGLKERSELGRTFAPAGQTTQMMVGAMNETDRTIAVLAESLYKKYEMKRVYYSPFGPPYESEKFSNKKTPQWRGRRLYQADRLMAIYGMTAEEILPESAPFLDFDVDPKASYALRNIGMFPVEVNTADYEMLIRVPGIGTTSAQKIVVARKHTKITHDLLKKMRVSLKKSIYFITCNGKYYGGGLLGKDHLRNRLWADEFVHMQGMEQMSMLNTHLLPIDYDVSV